MSKLVDVLNENYAEQEIAQLFPDQMDNYMSAEQVVNRFKQLNEEQRVKVFELSLRNYLFPSGWRRDYPHTPYPGILAKYLAKSKSAESLTDLTNIYYAGNELSKEAIDAFTNSLLYTEEGVKWVNHFVGMNEYSREFDILKTHMPELFVSLMRKSNITREEYETLITDPYKE